ncbi:hypothetical protein L484_018990 [Morus notabilis]|uniref:Glucuronosyltransferase PGSIP7 n=1 Tax=Morus notabilis TaxID=981085 RepID=W9QUE8_9ROSA|nr:hypothetical protein L484_018990 [Morus notabilis]
MAKMKGSTSTTTSLALKAYYDIYKFAVFVVAVLGTTSSARAERQTNAYATMMYMGTPRDYEFYVTTRVLLRSLSRLHVDADLVVIASLDVPLRWVHAW